MKKKILYVYSPAGPPLDYFYPKMRERADVYTCIVSPPSALNHSIIIEHSKEVDDFSNLEPEVVMKHILNKAKAIQADAIFTFAEPLLKSVSELATKLGLRGVGKNVQLSRNKLLMRERWEEAGIPQPKFCSLIEKSDVEHLQALKLPFIIKLAYGAGSIGQQIVNSFDEIDGAIECLIDATNQARKAGKHEFSEKTGFPLLIAEEIIESSTNSWYEQPGYGDYLSVEGLVKDGVYYPLAMTGRLPTIPPFTELCNLAPCVLDNEKKRQIIQWISRSIDALGFENCATHTEIKLMANGNISFLETAARMGGVAIAVELEEVFAIDYVDLFLSVILGEECEIPAFEMNEPRCAAASVALIGCDSNGTPWNCSRVFDPEAVDWNALLGGQCSVKIQYAQSIPVGADFPLYNNAGGVLNYAGQAFLTSDDPISLQKAAYNLLNNLEQFMPQKVEVVG